MDKKKHVKKHKHVVTINRAARYNYYLEETIEAGIALLGSEIKSIRQGQININTAFAEIKERQAWLLNAEIPVYKNAAIAHETKRARKLLLSKRQIKRLEGMSKHKQMTLIPTDVHFNRNGFAKINIAVARGKKEYDKRDVKLKRQWERRKSLLLKRK